jgi:hypothetical protein
MEGKDRRAHGVLGPKASPGRTGGSRRRSFGLSRSCVVGLRDEPTEQERAAAEPDELKELGSDPACSAKGSGRAKKRLDVARWTSSWSRSAWSRRFCDTSVPREGAEAPARKLRRRKRELAVGLRLESRSGRRRAVVQRASGGRQQTGRGSEDEEGGRGRLAEELQDKLSDSEPLRFGAGDKNVPDEFSKSRAGCR